ncbi:MAG: hypothetical protein GX621_11050 [Pirellulaceae bacterium]|nr:hypothetical protein [Pirellulaceae bacterium]
MARAWIIFLGASLTLVGCGRPIEPAGHEQPIRHEVQKPLVPTEKDRPAETEPSIEILFPDIPDIPERIQGPSRPIDVG